MEVEMEVGDRVDIIVSGKELERIGIENSSDVKRISWKINRIEKDRLRLEMAFKFPDEKERFIWVCIDMVRVLTLQDRKVRFVTQ